MPRYHSGVTWFEEDDWVGRVLVLNSPEGEGKWKVTQKTTENGDSESEADVKETGMDSSCRGVFVCSKVNDPGQEAVVKIRMQYILLVP